jgi:hypothetical protein
VDLAAEDLAVAVADSTAAVEATLAAVADTGKFRCG